MKSILKICDKYDGIDYRKPQCFERVKEVVIINDTEMLSFRIVFSILRRRKSTESSR